MSIKAPFIITGENLVLETPPPIESDIQIKELLSDNVTMQYLTAMTKQDQGGWSLENVIERRKNQEKQYVLGQSSSCAIYDKNNNFVGICGLRFIDISNRSGEFGIILDKKFWRKGYSSEAHLLSLTHSFEILGLNRVTFITSSSNEPMIYFLKNVLSSTHEATLREFINYNDETKGCENCELFSILSYEWPTVKKNLEKKLNISYKTLNIASKIVENKNKVVLLFGSGRVAKPVMRFFNKGNFHVIVATNDKDQAEELMSCIDDRNNSSYEEYTCPKDNYKLSDLFIKCDIIISLLPATMHIEIAKQAIISKKNLVTASYVSPAMKELHEQAKSAGITILNEVGLDPGIDHMLVMSAINNIRNRGGKIIKMTSLCGGIPDPIAANNPFRYKMSWSPRGMLAAICDNSAVYLKDNEIIKIDADKLLLSAVSCNNVIPTMRLEVLPNRDSLLYRNLYNVEDIECIFRGTLRYEGWGNIMNSLKAIGLFDKSNSTCLTWKELLLEKALIFDTLHGNDEACYSYDGELRDTIERILTQSNIYNIPEAMNALTWLGFTDDKIADSMKIKVNYPPIDSLASLLETKLCYENNDRDMVVMSHTVTGLFPNGDIEKHNSKLLAFGNSEDTAMASTVGYTAAAAAEFLLKNQLSEKFHGVLIPTDEEVYTPILYRLNDFNITWSETITLIKNNSVIIN